MRTNFVVGVFNKGLSTKVNGITIAGELKWVKQMFCDIQPYSTALLIKQYGYDIEVNKRMFMDVDTSIKIGTVLQYTNILGNIEKYFVKAIIPWSNYCEVMCLGI